MKLADIYEGQSEDGIHAGHNWDGEKWEPNIIKFKDRHAFIKACLNELTAGSVGDVQHWIDMAKNAGYDYPEFKTIEKSIKSHFDR